jgi:hypothetical protein
VIYVTYFSVTEQVMFAIAQAVVETYQRTTEQYTAIMDIVGFRFISAGTQLVILVSIVM